MFWGTLETKTYADLEAFIREDLREGLRLDYKRDFPGNLEKTISAMANAEGGVVLIGIDEDRVNPRHPLWPPVGVPTQQAEERTVSIAYQAIHEPLTPEVRAIQLPEQPERCVVVIRVSPSERAPHAVGPGRADLYVRID